MGFDGRLRGIEHEGLGRQLGGIEPIEQGRWCGRLIRFAQIEGGGQEREDLPGCLAKRYSIGQAHRPVALRQPLTVGSEHERHVGVIDRESVLARPAEMAREQ